MPELPVPPVQRPASLLASGPDRKKPVASATATDSKSRCRFFAPPKIAEGHRAAARESRIDEKRASRADLAPASSRHVVRQKLTRTPRTAGHRWPRACVAYRSTPQGELVSPAAPLPGSHPAARSTQILRGSSAAGCRDFATAAYAPPFQD